MNDTFSSDAWRKLQKNKQENCFSNLVQQQFQQKNQNDVAKKVRKSYEQLAFKDKLTHFTDREVKTLKKQSNPVNNRYLSVGFNGSFQNDSSTQGTDTIMGQMKKLDSSSFTQISSEFHGTKNLNDEIFYKGSKQTDKNDKKRQVSMASKVHSKFLLPNISTSRKLQIFDSNNFAEMATEDTMKARLQDQLNDIHNSKKYNKMEIPRKTSGVLIDRCLTNRRGLNNRQNRAQNM